MELVEVRATYVGPFAHETMLRVESGVTVLTGAYDTGKSSVLRLIDRFCRNVALQESEVNADYALTSGKPWEQDPDIRALFRFRLSDESRKHVTTSAPAATLVFSFAMAPRLLKADVSAYAENGAQVNLQRADLRRPRSLFLPGEAEVSDIINMASPSALEKKLLQVGFTDTFDPTHLAQLGPVRFTQAVHGANERLNNAIRALLPASMRFTFNLLPLAGNQQQLAVNLVDEHEGHVPLSLRGAGVRRVVTLIASLLNADLETGQTLVLFDEPETSLHADAQHTLRRVLEGLAERSNLQVLYATHSPSMINNLRPGGIRLFSRAQVEGWATSVIVNDPVRANYHSVRSGLGLSPSDSLLYAPVTVVVEGATEVVGLPIILERLRASGTDGFEDIDILLSQSHFLDGEGDSYEYLCRMAMSQGSRPVVFLDGDKAGSSQLKSFRKAHPDVPIVLLPPPSEFEEIVPREVYFAALAEHLGVSEGLTAEAYARWDAKAGLPDKMAFSKRVGRWLTQEFDVQDPQKPQVMRLALESVDLEELVAHPLAELAKVMRRLAD